MAFNEDLDKRINSAVSSWGSVRKKMFGGTCYILNGNMMCGVYRDFLILRLGESETSIQLEKPEVKAFDITGKPMKGWIMVNEKGYAGKALLKWLEKALVFVRTLKRK
jgi:TfoX/Sxy family transcriptional regulator of competence genes